jgi:hypothetical protein
MPAPRSASTEDAVWWTPTAPPAGPETPVAGAPAADAPLTRPATPSAPVPSAPVASLLEPTVAAMSFAPPPAPPSMPTSVPAAPARRPHPSDEVEAYLPPSVPVLAPAPTPPRPSAHQPVEIPLRRANANDVAPPAPRARVRKPRVAGGDARRSHGARYVGIGIAAAALGAAAYLFATRRGIESLVPLAPVAATAPAPSADAPPTGSATTAAAPAIAVVPVTTAPAPAPSSTAPQSNVPTGPVVADLPKTLPAFGRAAAHRTSAAGHDAEPEMPNVRALRLDGVTRDIEAKAKKQVDSATRVVPQNFKQQP